MTETLHDVPPPPPPAAPPPLPPRRLVRHPDDKVVAGVCAAAGRYTGTDPALWRVVVAALTLFGGVGLALYALAWLLVPRVDQPDSFVERHLRRGDRSVDVLGVAVVLLVAFVALIVLDGGSGIVLLAVVGGLAYLVSRERSGSAPGWAAAPTGTYTPPAGSYPTPTAPYAPPASGAGSAGPAWAAAPGVPPGGAPPGGTPAWAQPAGSGPGTRPAPAPRRPRSVLGPVTLSLTVLAAGALLLARELGADGITAARVLAVCMLVVGAGLVVGTWIGRARWLALVGVALGLLLVPVAALDGRLADGVGERIWVPTATTSEPEYRIGAGEATLDLRRFEPGALDRVSADVGFGHLIVLVPEDLPVRLDMSVGLGDVLDDGAPDVEGGSDLEEVRVLGPETGPRLEVDLHVGLGELEVRRVEG